MNIDFAKNTISTKFTNSLNQTIEDYQLMNPDTGKAIACVSYRDGIKERADVSGDFVKIGYEWINFVKASLG